MKALENRFQNNEGMKAFVISTVKKIREYKDSDLIASDLHNELFNTDYYIIGRYQAEQWLAAEFGIFNAIDMVKSYEQDNFGKVTTDLSEPERVANMVAYILGEELLNESETLREQWDNRLTAEHIEAIAAELLALYNLTA